MNGNVNDKRADIADALSGRQDEEIFATSSNGYVDLDLNSFPLEPPNTPTLRWDSLTNKETTDRIGENTFHIATEALNSIYLNETLRRSFAGGAASTIACFLFNPFDCLRVRWQVVHTEVTRDIAKESSKAWRPSNASEDTLFNYASHVIRNEGFVNGLWRPGLASNMIAMSLSSAIRFGGYEVVRDTLIEKFPSNAKEDGSSSKSSYHMLGAGLITGSVGYVAVTPFHYLKTRVQAERSMAQQAAGNTTYVQGNGNLLPGVKAEKAFRDGRISSCVVNGMKSLVNEGGILGLWKGWIPLAARGSLFTAGQVFGYDGCKTYAKQFGAEDSLKLHVVASVASSFFASLLSAPADIVMSKYMSSSSPYNARQLTFFECVDGIYRNGGIGAFWRGWPINFVRLTPAILTFSALYEELRRHLGIGYLS